MHPYGNDHIRAEGGTGQSLGTTKDGFRSGNAKTTARRASKKARRVADRRTTAAQVQEAK